MRNRVTIAIVSWTKNDQAGLVPEDVDTWEVWAHVKKTTGSGVIQNSQQVWQYDYEITKRREDSRPTKSNYEVRYKGVRMKINSVQVDSEGAEFFEVLRCSVVDEMITQETSS